MFFSDVHLVFRKEFVYRCRVNTVKGNQVYMPFIFRQYNRDIAYFNSSKPETSFVYTKSAGRWPTNEYGPLCTYGSDAMAVGGLNTAIEGWGMQDRDSTDRILRHGLSTFRAIFNMRRCDVTAWWKRRSAECEVRSAESVSVKVFL